MNTVYIGLGSNLNNPTKQLQSAFDTLANTVGVGISCCSSFYQSKAVGPGVQADYLNAVVCINTTLTPLSLLDILQDIEHKQQRTRDIRWGPRTIDLDILLYGDQVIASSRLQIPHPEMKNRNFVLYPLAEIAPLLQLPNGESLTSILASSSRQHLARLNQSFELARVNTATQSMPSDRSLDKSSPSTDQLHSIKRASNA